MPEWITRETFPITDFLAGAMILVDKPRDWTSFDVVNKVRGALRHVLGVKKIKVGHAGTLDPMATGLLILCTGKHTAKLAHLQGLEKEYTGVMTLGASTASYDAETPPQDPRPFAHLAIDDIRKAASRFTGQINQIPPMYSAIKVGGKPLYRAARKGQTVGREPRMVVIETFELLSADLPEVTFHVRCSKGTYIRSLAHDLGKSLGCGAYLSALRRTGIGTYDIREAWQLDELIESIANYGLRITDQK
jgi:tRNA pseudouridine55 synthase